MQIKELQTIATKARMEAVKMVHAAASGHIGGSLSSLDILTELYFSEMRIDPSQPKNPDRDRF